LRDCLVNRSSLRPRSPAGPLYLQLVEVEPGVDADLQVHQAGELGEHGDVGPEVPYRKADLVYLELGDVQQNVHVLAGWRFLRDAVVGRWLFLGHDACLLAVHGPPGALFAQ
jgi:hypothetical protein